MTVAPSGALMVVCTGLWAGGVLIIAVERLDRWEAMSIEDYVLDFRRVIGRDDPIMPLLAVVGIASAVVFAVTDENAPGALMWPGIAMSLSALVLSGGVLEPIQRRYRNSARDAVLPHAEQDRATWRRLHRIRTALVVGSFMLLTGAVSV